MPSSLRRSKIAGYTPKELVTPWLLHVSADVEADQGGLCPCGDRKRKGGREGGFAVTSLV